MIRKSITPEHDSAQIIFDRDRTHFFLVHYRADLKIVVIYDSMHGICKDGQNAMGKVRTTVTEDYGIPRLLYLIKLLYHSVSYCICSICTFVYCICITMKMIL